MGLNGQNLDWDGAELPTLTFREWLGAIFAALVICGALAALVYLIVERPWA